METVLRPNPYDQMQKDLFRVISIYFFSGSFIYFAGNHVAVTAGDTVFNASQMYKYRQTNMIRQSYQQEGQLNTKQVTALNIGKKSNNQGQQGDQLLNNDVLNNEQNVNNEQFKGRYVQEQDDREITDLSKLQENNKGLEYREKEPSEQLQQKTGKSLSDGEKDGRISTN